MYNQCVTLNQQIKSKKKTQGILNLEVYIRVFQERQHGNHTKKQNSY